MSVVYFKDDSEALAHYGVKGMKWGVRKDPKRAEKRAAKKREKAASKFEKRYARSWTDSYNRAADAEAPNLARINAKYSKYDFRKINPGQPNPNVDAQTQKAWNSYVREIGKSWVNTYSNTLLSDFGEHPIRGKEWVSAAPFMNMYDEYLIPRQRGR